MNQENGSRTMTTSGQQSRMIVPPAPRLIALGVILFLGVVFALPAQQSTAASPNKEVTIGGPTMLARLAMLERSPWTTPCSLAETLFEIKP